MRITFLSSLSLGLTWLALSAGSGAYAQGPDRSYGPHMWDGGWWMFLGPIWMIVVIGAIVAVIVLVVRWLGGPSHASLHYPPASRTPIDILKERFARGEIDKAEFEERRKLLE